MNLMDAILNAKGTPLTQLSRKFGLDESDMAKVVTQFLPALTNGIKRNTEKKGGLDSLLGALGRGGHDRYLDDPGALSSEAAAKDGNGILGHLFGSKDTSRQLSRRAAKNTGLDYGVLKKILPLVAGLAMGALKKQGGSSGILSNLTGSRSSSSFGSLLSLLDADGDSSPIDDILGIAGKLFSS